MSCKRQNNLSWFARCSPRLLATNLALALAPGREQCLCVRVNVCVRVYLRQTQYAVKAKVQ